MANSKNKYRSRTPEAERSDCVLDCSDTEERGNAEV